MEKDGVTRIYNYFTGFYRDLELHPLLYDVYPTRSIDPFKREKIEVQDSRAFDILDNLDARIVNTQEHQGNRWNFAVYGYKTEIVPVEGEKLIIPQSEYPSLRSARAEYIAHATEKHLGRTGLTLLIDGSATYKNLDGKIVERYWCRGNHSVEIETYDEIGAEVARQRKLGILD